MRMLSRWLLKHSQVMTATALLAVSCGAVGVLGFIADAVTVRGPGSGASGETASLLEVVSLILNAYLMPAVLAISLLAALNVWLSVRARKNPVTAE
jgi:hypothetical protein